MSYLNKINNFFKSGNSKGCGCLSFGVSRFRLKTSSGRALATSSQNFSTSELMGTFGKTQLRINSTQPLYVDLYVEYRTYCTSPMYEPMNGKEIVRKRNLTRNGITRIMKGMYETKSDEDFSSIKKELKSIVQSKERLSDNLSDICLKLNSRNLDLNVVQLTRILYYLSVLKLNNEAIYMRLTGTICNKLSEVKKPSPIINSLFKSIRKSLIRDTKSIDRLLVWYFKKGHDVNTTIEIICTLAVLNYFPEAADDLLQQTAERRKIYDYSNFIQYFNYVWSLVLIDRANENLVHSVLNYTFWEKLEHSSLLGPRNVILSKFKNIYAYSKIRNFKCGANVKWVEFGSLIHMLKKKRESDLCFNIFRDVVVTFFPLHTYSFCVEGESGCIIDAICYLNTDSTPITEFQCMRSENNIKLAIMLLMYQDYCFPGKTVPNGIVMFHKKFLESSGYKVIFLRYDLLPKEESLETKFQILQKNIREVVPNFSLDEPKAPKEPRNK